MVDTEAADLFIWPLDLGLWPRGAYQASSEQDRREIDDQSDNIPRVENHGSSADHEPEENRSLALTPLSMRGDKKLRPEVSFIFLSLPTSILRAGVREA